MTDTTTVPRIGSWPRRLAERIATMQRRLSDRAHADGDAFAAERGWTVTAATGRFGFGARIYRDPRFDQRASAARLPAENARGRSDAGST
jgi:hypothetical protein